MLHTEMFWNTKALVNLMVCASVLGLPVPSASASCRAFIKALRYFHWLFHASGVCRSRSPLTNCPMTCSRLLVSKVPTYSLPSYTCIRQIYWFSLRPKPDFRPERLPLGNILVELPTTSSIFSFLSIRYRLTDWSRFALMKLQSRPPPNWPLAFLPVLEKRMRSRAISSSLYSPM